MPKTNLSILGLITCVVATVSACAPNSSSSETKIVNGTVSAKNSVADTSAISLYTKNEDGTMASYCGATLIAQNLIVSAAHCFDTLDGEQVYAAIRRNPKLDDLSGFVKVDAFQVHPMWNEQTAPHHDISWARLATAAPASFKPVTVLKSSAPLKLKPEVLIAGFGQTASVCPEEGCSDELREATTKIVNFIENRDNYAFIVTHDPIHQRSACRGDSGGPAYIKQKDKWLLAGIVHGFDDETTQSETIEGQECETGQIIYTFVSPYVDWIQKTSKIKVSAQ
ncbi:MAG: trypsin-like serine protease [Proteobacteria bacterium]|nr:MAG: trypsin-like serine protease [Pseudomonadota bacterium]